MGVDLHSSRFPAAATPREETEPGRARDKEEPAVKPTLTPGVAATARVEVDHLAAMPA